MGWFWADSIAPSSAAGHPGLPSSHPTINGASPPHGCPMHNSTVDNLSLHTIHPPSAAGAESSASSSKPSGCPVPHDKRGGFANPASAAAAAAGGCPVKHDAPAAKQEPSAFSKINPLNYMFQAISQERAPNQEVALPTSRDESTIPRGDGGGNWEYPSPQQMYNALLRKGYTDTDATAVEGMVAVHNFLNEGAWSEIVDWERRFGRGLARGWQISSRGEENAEVVTQTLEHQEGSQSEPKLIRFQGRPGEMTPKAAVLQFLGKVYPSKFGTEPPFDRHDWYVARTINGKERQIRYVIDYYSGEPEPTGEPVFYLDVRPAMTPTGAVERLMRWSGDVWWRASGGEARESWPKLN